MWPFKKKTAKPEPVSETWFVPEDQAEKFCELHDKMVTTVPGKLETYRFWKFVQSILPDNKRRLAMTVEFKYHKPSLLIKHEN